jgi:hypothetical protein
MGETARRRRGEYRWKVAWRGHDSNPARLIQQDSDRRPAPRFSPYRHANQIALSAASRVAQIAGAPIRPFAVSLVTGTLPAWRRPRPRLPTRTARSET